MRDNTAIVFELLEQITSLTVVSDFLRAKGLHHSASSWGDMITKRLRPALEAGELTYLDLVSLLGRVEEYGHQHVFLYSCSPELAAKLLKPANVEKAAIKNELDGLMGNPLVLDQPESASISAIRLEVGPDNKNKLIIKLVETRVRYEFVNEDTQGDTLTRKYRRKSERAVNVAVLSEDGLLEIRIARQSNSSKYQKEVIKFVDQINDFIPFEKFVHFSMGKAKDRLWDDRKKLKEKIRYSDSTLCNGLGTKLRAATSTADYDLSEDSAASDSLDSFKDNDAYCESSNIWFLKNEVTEIPPKDIHVYLTGEVNEFALPAHCSSVDYHYVLSELRKLNK